MSFRNLHGFYNAGVKCQAFPLHNQYQSDLAIVAKIVLSH